MAVKLPKITVCPKCGGDCSSIVYGDISNNLCPYCGHEIYDYSREIYDEKIEQVEGARKTLLGIPRVAAITIIVTLAVLFAGLISYYVFHIDRLVEDHLDNADGDKYTRKMEKCYQDEDWEGLYKLVILDFDKTMSSKYYFAYRTAWFVNFYPDEFDKAYASGDVDRMKEIYDHIKSDYDMRIDSADLFGGIYGVIDEVEEELVTEYERETEIMNKVEGK